MTNEELGRQLGRIEARLESIDNALKNDYRHLHGNGQPGLLTRVQQLEDLHKNENQITRKLGLVVAWLVNAVIATVALFKHQN